MISRSYDKNRIWKMLIISCFCAFLLIGCGQTTNESISNNEIANETVSASNLLVQPVITDYSGFVKIERAEIGGVRVLKNTVMKSGDDFVTYEDGSGVIEIGDLRIDVSADTCLKIVCENEEKTSFAIKLIYGDITVDYKNFVEGDISYKLCSHNTIIEKAEGIIKMSYIPHYQKTVLTVEGGNAEVIYDGNKQLATDKGEFAGNVIEDHDFDKNNSTPVYMPNIDLYVNDKAHYINDFHLQDGYDMSAVLDEFGETDVIDIYQNEELLCTIESPVTFAVGFSGEVVYHEENDDYVILVYEKIIEKMDTEVIKVPSGKYTYSCFIKVDNPPYDKAADDINEETGELSPKAKKAKQDNRKGFYIRLASYEGSEEEIIERYKNVIENVLPTVKNLHLSESTQSMTEDASE